MTQLVLERIKNESLRDDLYDAVTTSNCTKMKQDNLLSENQKLTVALAMANQASDDWAKELRRDRTCDDRDVQILTMIAAAFYKQYPPSSINCVPDDQAWNDALMQFVQNVLTANKVRTKQSSADHVERLGRMRARIIHILRNHISDYTWKSDEDMFELLGKVLRTESPEHKFGLAVLMAANDYHKGVK